MTSMARVFITALLIFCAVTAPARSDEFIVVQSTTSTENSGLFAHLLPLFTKKTGIEVRVVAVGTGQALKNARNGDGDVLLVHDAASERSFVADGWGVQRYDLMYNDFILVGPSHDPADVAGEKHVVAAFNRIAETKVPFASRGDDSGTQKAELRVWKEAGIDVKAASGTWYREIGQGMGATLNTAIGMDAYALTDRATWSAFKNRANHAIMVEGDQKLFNQYGVILVNPGKHPNVRAANGQIFIDWLVSKEGQEAIASFQINGERLFFPNARQ